MFIIIKNNLSEYNLLKNNLFNRNLHNQITIFRNINIKTIYIENKNE